MNHRTILILMVLLVTIVSCTVLMVSHPKGDVEIHKEIDSKLEPKKDIQIGKKVNIDTLNTNLK